MKQEEPRPNHYNVKVLEKAFAVLDLLASGPTSLKDVSAALEMNKTTAFRLLACLEAYGYATKSPADGQYYLGHKVLELGCRLLPGSDLLGAARSFLFRLVEATAETGEVSVRQGQESTVIASLSGSQTITAFIPIGIPLPLHCGASAKVLLAFAPDEVVGSYLTQPTLARLASESITEPERLRAELSQIREQGYATSRGEVDPELFGLGVPVRNAEGQVVAALAVVVPVSRAQPAHIEELRVQVARIGAEFSERLGYRAARHQR